MKKVFMGMPSFSALGLKKQMLALAIIAGVSLATFSTVEAAIVRNTNPPALKADAPNVYVVKKGDTLWGISKRYLKNPARWPEIWASNKHVKNPHWIFPGDRLLICSYNGRTIIGKDEGDGCNGIIARYAGDTKIAPQIRVESLNNSIPVIPLDDIKYWLERSIVINPDSITNTPYVVGVKENRVIAGKGQTIYARGNGLEVGQHYGVYREGEPYLLTDANGHKYNAGLELTQVATGIAVNNEKDITSLELTNSYSQEVRRNDRVLPIYDPMLPTLFYPTYADSVTQGGQIIRVAGSIGTAAIRGVVTINRGSLNGIQAGQIFAINQKGEVIRDTKANQNITLPDEHVGQIMVFKPFDHISYAYVLESELPIKVGDKVVSPLLDE